MTPSEPPTRTAEHSACQSVRIMDSRGQRSRQGGDLALIGPELASWLARAGASDAAIRRHYDKPVPPGVDDLIAKLVIAANTRQPLGVAVDIGDGAGVSPLSGVLTLAEVADVTGLSPRSVSRRLGEGRLRAIKRGRQKFVPAEEVVRFLEESA